MKILLLLIFATFASADWWETANFYQIYPRSFKDSNNDGIGDIRGIIQKLPYLKETGVTATWLSPILKSPQVDFGYDVADFTQVDEIFGTNADIEELFQEASKLGIKVIMDFVPNHTSDEHEWFLKSVAREPGFEDFYVWHDGKPNPLGGRPLPPNNWQAVFATRAWTWNEEREQYYLHQFAAGQPDLNYRNPRVVQEMRDVLIFWLDMGAAGFRVDAINHMFEIATFDDEPLTGWTDDPNNYGYTHHIYTKDLNETYAMVQEWRVMIDAYNAEKGGETRVLFTEAYASLQDTLRYYADEQGNPRAHFPFNFALIENLNEYSNAHDFKREIDTWIDNVPAGMASNWVLGNHDKPRFGSRYGTERIDGLLLLLLTLPGVAVTYNGDEIGMLDYRDISWDDTMDPAACNTNDPNNFKDSSRDPVRTPFQWDSSAYAGFKEANGVEPWIQVHPNYPTLNLAQQKSAIRSHYKVYQQLAQLRTLEAFQKGDFQSHAYSNEVFAYKRSYAGSSYIVLINFGSNSQAVDLHDLDPTLPETVEVALAGSMSPYYPGYKDGQTSEFVLAAYDSVIVTVAEPVVQTTPTPITPPTAAPTNPTLPTTVTTPGTSSTTTDAGSTLVASFVLLFSSLFFYHFF